jgi:hypothetical protein
MSNTDTKTNWVELRFLREKNLKEGASKVWADTVSAIRDACDSFNTHFSPANTNFHTENNTVTVGVDRKVQGYTIITVDFLPQGPSIVVTTRAQVKIVFQIASDEKHAFITTDAKEITPDEFSRLVLEEAMFKPPKIELIP